MSHVIRVEEAVTIMRELTRVFSLYQQRGFDIIEIHADLEFEKCRTLLHPIWLVTVAKDAHVPGIERSVQTSKHKNCIIRLCIFDIVSYGAMIMR